MLVESSATPLLTIDEWDKVQRQRIASFIEHVFQLTYAARRVYFAGCRFHFYCRYGRRDSDEEPVFSVELCASDARSDEKDSSDEGAADITILKPSFLPWKIWN